MNKPLATDPMITPLFSKLDLKAKSLLVTVWGDAVAPHGGTVWLGSLINLVAPLGLNERVVRTAVFRLQKERLLASNQIGRRSFYRLTKTGGHRFAEATRRIYASGDISWDGNWLFLFALRRELAEKDRRKLETELGWLGFGNLGGGIYAHPTASAESVDSLLSDLDLAGKVTALRATGTGAAPFDAPEILVAKGWALKELEADYARFIHHFGRFADGEGRAPSLDEKKCFIIRSLLVHDYRRVLLRDPMLPAELLPKGWNGNQARSLFRTIYDLVWEGAETYLMTILENETGRLPPASEEFYRRFGGLKKR
ncbi:phenylacetic acid degradation operon negative regulatory protein PaaX [Sneathiella sp. HT1-7]|uniref:phenylacetic acid degradation operon negative regulatory protein PaaX n=1 Tax=Sneathiella sp. HT1-7 TaxID=2887192 RepID=UPI001D152388|nr:phenylacetic acid degradation operon negative regulatory protein PaaX [Sneathiella sp. HT1-7]MCC3304899.1 phenylacetic acid degradation operon negative regulatory protein PaaX [Sneathiella sp. HT1-7]